MIYKIVSSRLINIFVISGDNFIKNVDSRIRIIAGKWRGSKISVVEEEGLRPTKDRIRETLFNWLSPEIIGANCLDLFAGTGALSFESLSRGANHVTAIEKSKKVFESLKKNSLKLKADNIKLVNADALDWLQSGYFNSNDLPKYDLIFLDPPFNSDLLACVANLLESNNFLSQGTLLYVEQAAEKKLIELPKNWERIKHKKSGEVDYALFHL